MGSKLDKSKLPSRHITVDPAYRGAVTHPGGAAETSSYADI